MSDHCFGSSLYCFFDSRYLKTNGVFDTILTSFGSRLVFFINGAYFLLFLHYFP